MKTKSFLLFVPLMSLALTSCSNVLNWNDHLDSYVRTMQFHDDFNILQLTDIHWNANSSTMASKTYMSKLIKEVDDHIKATQGLNAKIDLVELTGDMFMLSNTYHVKTFIEFFEEQAEKYGFTYTAIWGNHDRHGLYNPNWLSASFAQAKHCIYVEPEDNLYGRSNFVINLVRDSGSTAWQIVNLDSGASFSETAISPFRDYDYIRQDQVDWWVQEHNQVSSLINPVPTIAYYHIPQQDNLIAWNSRQGRTNKFFKLEGFGDNGTEKYASKFIETGKTNNLKAAFMGHAHNIDWTVDYDGVVLGLGVKTGAELYYAHIDPADNKTENLQEGLASIQASVEPGYNVNQKFDLIGASLVTINNDLGILSTFELEHVYFNERDNGDFVAWVKW